MRYTKLVSQPVPQSEPLNSRQTQNNAGGYVFQIDIWARLDRFLILGSDSPTYYQTAKALTRENAKVVTECFDTNPVKTIDAIVSVSVEGRAPKNDSAIFALAIGASHSDVKVRQLACGALPAVCRTSTHLFQFVQTVRALGRGWGPTLKKAVARWYNDMPVDSVAYQVVKYREREGYTHKRLMQTAHPDPGKDKHRLALYKWIWGKDFNRAQLPKIVTAHETAMAQTLTKKALVELIHKHNLPWEALPTECNKDPDIWAAQLPTIGLTALIRNLGNMSRIGLIKPLSEAERTITARFQNEDDIRKARLHPFTILQAMSTYSSGKGFRGSNSWDVSQPVVDALDKAFYKSFKYVEPTGKRHLIALDVSGSMTSPFGGSSLSCRDATAALALLTMSIEPQTHVIGFTGGHNYNRRSSSNGPVTVLNISPRQRLNDAISVISNLDFGTTDCALPMIYALEKGLEVDVFSVYTDNETWAGSVHPMEALRTYRKKTGIRAKLIVVGMTSTGFSIADPQDGGAMDVVGFDSAAPAVMADFARK